MEPVSVRLNRCIQGCFSSAGRYGNSRIDLNRFGDWPDTRTAALRFSASFTRPDSSRKSFSQACRFAKRSKRTYDCDGERVNARACRNGTAAGSLRSETLSFNSALRTVKRNTALVPIRVLDCFRIARADNHFRISWPNLSPPDCRLVFHLSRCSRAITDFACVICVAATLISRSLSPQLFTGSGSARRRSAPGVPSDRYLAKQASGLLENVSLLPCNNQRRVIRRSYFIASLSVSAANYRHLSHAAVIERFSRSPIPVSGLSARSVCTTSLANNKAETTDTKSRRSRAWVIFVYPGIPRATALV